MYLISFANAVFTGQKIWRGNFLKEVELDVCNQDCSSLWIRTNRWSGIS